MVELSRRKVKIIFCDEQRNPAAEVMPCYGSYDASGKLRSQIAWPKERKDLLWVRLFARKSESNRPCFSTRMRRSVRECWKPMPNA